VRELVHFISCRHHCHLRVLNHIRRIQLPHSRAMHSISLVRRIVLIKASEGGFSGSRLASASNALSLRILEAAIHQSIVRQFGLDWSLLLHLVCILLSLVVILLSGSSPWHSSFVTVGLDGAQSERVLAVALLDELEGLVDLAGALLLGPFLGLILFLGALVDRRGEPWDLTIVPLHFVLGGGRCLLGVPFLELVEVVVGGL